MSTHVYKSLYLRRRCYSGIKWNMSRFKWTHLQWFLVFWKICIVSQVCENCLFLWAWQKDWLLSKHWYIGQISLYTQKNKWRILKNVWPYNIWDNNFQTKWSLVLIELPICDSAIGKWNLRVIGYDTPRQITNLFTENLKAIQKLSEFAICF